MNDSPKVGDFLGIAPVARAVERVADSAISGLENVLARVCLPAAEEFGLALRDRVGAWRQRNAVETVKRAKPMLEVAAAEGRQASPRLLMEVLEQAGWSDNKGVQEMWAGLLASSCTTDGLDDSNWIFVNLLRSLTTVEAATLREACESARKLVTENGLITSEGLDRTAEDLCRLTGCSDVQRIDRELDHLNALGLLEGGFSMHMSGAPIAYFRPTALALHMYVRCQGSLDSPLKYFGLHVQPAAPAPSADATRAAQ